jgi:hypothetical protein
MIGASGNRWSFVEPSSKTPWILPLIETIGIFQGFLGGKIVAKLVQTSRDRLRYVVRSEEVETALSMNSYFGFNKSYSSFQPMRIVGGTSFHH